jgi:probable F420-dependent oxidoreductase
MVLTGLKFGICLPSWNEASAFYGGLDYSLIRPYAMLCEELGYDTLWAPDHFILGDAMYECWTLLAAIAAVTEKIRIGSLLLCYSHRNPSLVAKMAATLDIISGGRLNFGIGAGWHKDEHLAYAFDWSDEPAKRINDMIEAIKIIKALWTQERATYRGASFNISDAICNPKPVQRPHPPVWIGGGGEKLLLRAVANYADGWNVPSLPAEQYARKLRVLKEHCERNGIGFERIEKSVETRIMVTNDQWEVEKIRKWVASFSSYDKDAPRTTDILDTYIIGDLETCHKRIEEYQRAGVQHFMLYLLDFPSTRTLKILSHDIIPSFR